MSDIQKTMLITDTKKWVQKIKSPLYKRDAFLEGETGVGVHEVIMDERKGVVGRVVGDGEGWQSIGYITCTQIMHVQVSQSIYAQQPHLR